MSEENQKKIFFLDVICHLRTLAMFMDNRKKLKMWDSRQLFVKNVVLVYA